MSEGGFDGHQLKILVVEDNMHFRRLIHTVLGALGVRYVVEAEDGEQALDVMKTQSVDIAIVDYRMEPMDGLQFTQKVRLDSESLNPYLPIIMVTGHTETDLVLKARDAGVNEFLAKPISAKSLLSRLLAVIQKPRPFVRIDDYFGPDRRRRQVPFKGDDRRDLDEVLLG